MPPVNHAALASAGIIVASVAVAAAIALYESPELRRVADDFRRRIAIALHALGDNVDPNRRDPLFNRPEDAEGFLQSRGGVGADAGVDADDETRRRQREELMYWNARREEMREQQRRESQQTPPHPSTPTRALTFDDFLQEDKNAERGTFVYNTGASVWADDQQQGLVRRRGNEGVRGLHPSAIANPFGDEYGIELNEKPPIEEPHHPNLGREETVSDIYDATPRDGRSTASQTLSPQSKPVVPEVLFDFDSRPASEVAPSASSVATADHSRPSTLERELAENEFMTAGQDDRHEQDAYASIQAWAHGSSPGFYSPLPESPAAPLSEPELVSEGALTPTDSISLAGSGEDIGNDTTSTKNGDYDVMSENGDGIATPNSWSEVGSVISEADVAAHA